MLTALFDCTCVKQFGSSANTSALFLTGPVIVGTVTQKPFAHSLLALSVNFGDPCHRWQLVHRAYGFQGCAEPPQCQPCAHGSVKLSILVAHSFPGFTSWLLETVLKAHLSSSKRCCVSPEPKSHCCFASVQFLPS